MRVKTFFLLARVPLCLFVDLQDVPSTETFCERTTKVTFGTPWFHNFRPGRYVETGTTSGRICAGNHVFSGWEALLMKS